MGLGDTEGAISLVVRGHGGFMSCYHPLIGVPSGSVNLETGKEKILICKKDNINFDEIIENGWLLIPCGHCIGCRLDYSRSWADRMMLELETAKKGLFLTLTYDNEHCPWSQFDKNGLPLFGTLNKRDCQLFMKRLRKRFENVKIRFFLAGEYGENTLRPHYHCIVFGLGLDDLSDVSLHGRNEFGDNYYTSPELEKIWSNGFVLVANVSWKTCAYVARYITKKLSGDAALSYSERNVLPEFSLMSRKPGIGADFLEKHPDVLDYNSINLSTPDGGLKIQMPKYYLRKLELSDPERYDRIKAERKKYASDKMLLELSKTDLSYLNYLEVKEQNKLEKIKALKRKV